jgi:Ca2+-binding EF-hand superfamily protein
MLDFDNSGKLSIVELKNRLGHSIPEDVYQILVKDFDKNKDGEVSLYVNLDLQTRVRQHDETCHS